MSVDGQPASDMPSPIPIVATSLGPSLLTGLALAPGTPSFYRLGTSTGTANVTVQFSAADGTPLLATLHLQVSVYRLPAGP